MKYYDVRVRLDGSLLEEVNRKRVTAAEVYILRAVHEDDAVIVTKVHQKSNDKTPHREVREALNDRYKLRVVNAVFGPAGQLPTTLDEKEEARRQGRVTLSDKAGKKDGAAFDKAVQAEVDRRLAEQGKTTQIMPEHNDDDDDDDDGDDDGAAIQPT